MTQDEVDNALIDTLESAEQARFFSHDGYDLDGWGNAWFVLDTGAVVQVFSYEGRRYIERIIGPAAEFAYDYAQGVTWFSERVRNARCPAIEKLYEVLS